MKNLTPAQQQAWPVRNQHYLLNCAGRGWGKTMHNAALLVEYAYYRSRPTLYINKTFNNAMDQIWGDLGELLGNTLITPSKMDKSKGYMEFSRNGLPSGSIKIGGLDSKPAADVYRGYEYALAILDEAFYLKGDLKYFIEDVLEPRMGKFEDRLIVASCSPPRAKRAYFEAMRVSWPIVSGNMRDNPHMQSSWGLFEEKKALNTNTARREWLGIWEYDEDALIWHPCDWTEPEHVTGIVCGLDWGFDSTNFVIVGFDRPSGRAWVLDEFKKPGMMVSEQVEMVKRKLTLARELAVKHGVKGRVSIQCDTNEKAVSQELYMTHRLPIETAFNKQNKRHSIRKMDDWFRTGKLYIPEAGPCRDECMEAVWKREAETDAIIDEVDDAVFHPQIMDALRYAMDRAWFDMGV